MKKALAIPVVSTSKNPGPTFPTMLKVRPVIINSNPSIPNIPKPGIANISTAKRINPKTNNKISQLLARPSM